MLQKLDLSSLSHSTWICKLCCWISRDTILTWQTSTLPWTISIPKLSACERLCFPASNWSSCPTTSHLQFVSLQRVGIPCLPVHSPHCDWTGGFCCTDAPSVFQHHCLLPLFTPGPECTQHLHQDNLPPKCLLKQKTTHLLPISYTHIGRSSIPSC